MNTAASADRCASTYPSSPQSYLEEGAKNLRCPRPSWGPNGIFAGRTYPAKWNTKLYPLHILASKPRVYSKCPLSETTVFYCESCLSLKKKSLQTGCRQNGLHPHQPPRKHWTSDRHLCLLGTLQRMLQICMNFSECHGTAKCNDKSPTNIKTLAWILAIHTLNSRSSMPKPRSWIGLPSVLYLN